MAGYCRQCGTPLRENALHCTQCGLRVAPKPSNQQQEQLQQPFSPRSPDEDQRPYDGASPPQRLNLDLHENLGPYDNALQPRVSAIEPPGRPSTGDSSAQPEFAQQFPPRVSQPYFRPSQPQFPKFESFVGPSPYNPLAQPQFAQQYPIGGSHDGGQPLQPNLHSNLHPNLDPNLHSNLHPNLDPPGVQGLDNQQQPVQLPQQTAPKKQKNRKVRWGVACLVIAVLGVVGTIAVCWAIDYYKLDALAEADYFEMDKDRIPSVKLAVGSRRAPKSATVTTSRGGEVKTKKIKFKVGGTNQNLDLQAYSNHLEWNDGFVRMMDLDFTSQTGVGALTRNSYYPGYSISLQYQYHTEGYTIIITRSPGSVPPKSP